MSPVAYRLHQGSIIAVETGVEGHPTSSGVTIQINGSKNHSFAEAVAASLWSGVATLDNRTQTFQGAITFVQPIVAPPAVLPSQLTTLTQVTAIASSGVSSGDFISLSSVVTGLGNSTATLQSGLSSHLTNFSNPHAVTKTQIGLGNVDNTTDLSKPISTATQTALDGKASKIVVIDDSSITGAHTFLRADGELQKATVTGALTINATGTEGQRLELWLTATAVSDAARTITFNGAILVPSDSAFTGSKVLEISKLYIIALKRNGTAWMLVSLVGGY